MDQDDLKPEDLINIKQMNAVPQRSGPKVDDLVSKIVGKTIYVNNPNLIKLIAKWKKEKGDDESQDNFLEDPKKVEELKKTL